MGFFLPVGPPYVLTTPKPTILKDSSDLQTHLWSCLQDTSTLNMSTHECAIMIPPKLLLTLFSMSPPSSGDPSGKPASSATFSCPPHIQTPLAQPAKSFIIWYIYVFPASSPSTFHLEFELQPHWITCSSSDTRCSLSLSKSLFKLLLLCGISSTLL